MNEFVLVADESEAVAADSSMSWSSGFSCGRAGRKRQMTYGGLGDVRGVGMSGGSVPR